MGKRLRGGREDGRTELWKLTCKREDCDGHNNNIIYTAAAAAAAETGGRCIELSSSPSPTTTAVAVAAGYTYVL